MRRVLILLTVMAMMVAAAMPAMAANYENANCVGYITSNENQVHLHDPAYGFPGAGGQAYTSIRAQHHQGINEDALYGTCLPY
jgi:hypothetical protein